MTTAQNRYWTLVEDKRHNRAQETNARYATDVQAATSKYSTDTQAATSRYSTDTQAATSRYAAELGLEGTKYSADKHYEGTVYAADSSAETSRYVSDQNAATQRYVSDQNAATQRYSADLQAKTNKYSTDISAAVNRARLAFDRQTQIFKNAMERKRINLAQLQSQFENAHTYADTQRIRQQTEKLLTDARIATEQLAIQAKDYGLREEAAKYNNALTQFKSDLTQQQTAEGWLDFASKGLHFIDDVINFIGG